MPQEQAVIEDVPAEEATDSGPLRTSLRPSEILARLDHAARRGRLAGYRPLPDGSGFRALLYGEPFDHDLEARFESVDGETIIRFETRMRRKLPVIFAITIVLAVWPGLPLTDSLLATYFPAYPNQMWVTAAWYLPLTILPLPWMLLRMWRRSRAAAEEGARKRLGEIRGELGAGA